MGNRPGSHLILALVGVGVAVVLFGGLYLYTNSNSAPAVPNQNIVANTQKEVPSPIIDSDVTQSPSINTVIEVTGGEFFYKPNEIKVKVGEKVTINFKNSGGFHDFVIDELGINSGKIAAGETKEVTFTPTSVGTFEYYCSVGQHRTKGMKGSLIVEQIL